MGGDHGPSVVVPAALKALALYPHLHITLVGQKIEIEKWIDKPLANFENRLIIHHASEVVAMDEQPALALRSKKDSSMRIAVDLVKAGKVSAAVSAGNTGALMAIARFVLKMLPGIDRPAIIYALPSDGPCGRIRMLDLGANVDCDAEHLYEFAVMGSVLTAAVDRMPAPRIALLNIGSEAIKGRKSVKEASELLTEHQVVNYIGFIEGNELYSGKADVVVCDGFVGNVSLKTSEGVARLFFNFLKTSIKKSLWRKFVAWLAKPMLMEMHERFDPSRYNGASFLGLNGIVVKSHGNANEFMFIKAIEEAMLEVEHNVPEQIRTELAQRLKMANT